jgi:uncharacterized delta-60 repeat protein
MQPDGKMLMAGTLTRVHGVTQNLIARLNADGSADKGFLNGLDGVSGGMVRSVAVQADGKILIGGNFTSVNGAHCHLVARLNADGSTDLAFNSGLHGADDWVDTVAAQPDGKVVVGGYFTAVNRAGPSMIARLDTDGSLDADFVNGVRVTGDPPNGWDYQVGSVVVQADGKILIGGGFKSVNGVSRLGLARLNADGSLDTGFLNGLEGPSPSPYALVYVAVQADRKILIWGAFQTVNGVSRPGLARLNPDGSLDTGFFKGLSGVPGWVSCMAMQPDGKMLIGGGFGTVNGVSRPGLARLNPDGSLDTGFFEGFSGPDSGVSFVAVQPGGKVVIIGDFASVNGAPAWAIARLHGSTGQLHPSLSIRDTGTHVLLSWPLVFSDYTVQSTDSIAPWDWQPVTAPIKAVESQFQVSLPPTNHAQFFRLWKP